ELRSRRAKVRADGRVVGLEIAPSRGSAAASAADPPWLTFRRGGFALTGLRPVLVRARNVLRQYPLEDVAPAWSAMCARAGTGVEGTCEELGRLACWVRLSGSGPVSLPL